MDELIAWLKGLDWLANALAVLGPIGAVVVVG
jgi:hypothetical protein